MSEPQGVFQYVTPALEKRIVTPHEHEGKGHPPLWVIWVVERSSITDVPYFPVLDSVCDSEDSARYHVGARLESGVKGMEVYVERIPANHRFGSSLPELQQRSHMAAWKAREKNEGYL